MKHWGWNWSACAVKMVDHNWLVQVLKRDRTEPWRWNNPNSYKQVPSDPAAWTTSTESSLHSSFIFFPLVSGNVGPKSPFTCFNNICSDELYFPIEYVKCSAVFFFYKKKNSHGILYPREILTFWTFACSRKSVLRELFQALQWAR